jgi:rhamnulokinase
MAKEGYVAFDLGAESGRAMLAVLDGGKLKLTEAHRFPNIPVRLPSGLHWNLTELWQNLVTGLKKAGELAREQKVKLVSLGVDTWGVDYGLVGKSGQLVGLPFAYRDERNGPAMKRVMKSLGTKRIYDVTGIQFMPFNTLYQLAAEAKVEPAVLAEAKHLLMMPDLLHYFFSGKAVVEETIASTTQMIDPRSKHGTWAKAMLTEAGIPTQLLGKIVPAGTAIGTLRDELAKEAGVDAIKVIVPGSHDTASAVAAVPVDMNKKQRWAYLSSGTWSLMGAELDKPLINDATLKASFTNERGVGGKIRFLKNIAGLWLVQECRRDFERKGESYSYQQLTDLAAEATPFRTLVDPGHGPFASPGDMLAKIDAFAKATGQPKPTSPGEYVRCCLESLALKYRQTLSQLEALLGEPFDVLHIVGGGGQNRLLNQMTADAIGKPVSVGPFEATAIGNALTQAIGHGQVKDLTALRNIVRASTDLLEYTPKASDAYTAVMPRYESLLGK